MSSDLWSEEYDSIPLGLRFKMLHSNRFRNDSCDNTPNSPTTIADIGNSTQQASDYVSSLHSLDFDMTRVDATLHQITSHISGNVLQDCLLGSGSGFSSSSSSVNMQASHLKLDEFDDSLDTVMLGERRKLLLSRKLIQNSKLDTVDQDNGKISNSSRVMLHNSENDSNRDALISEHANEVNGSDNVALGNASGAISQIPKTCSEPMPLSSAISTKSRSHLLSEKGKSCGTEEPDIMDPPAAASSVLPLLVKVKNEPLDINEFCSEGKNIIQNSFVGPTLSVKKEPELSEYHPVDELDHMSLANRLNLLSSEIPSLEVSGNPVLVNEDVASGLDFGNDVLESVKPISIFRPRKKRRTATDSVETALEEDAPGLLKVLLERGVSAEEIKLYGEEDGDDALDDSFGEDGFAELEAVISQLFSQRQTFLKFPLLRTKGAKVNYCLSCLLSLVEQTKYLQSRKWPVEWGWCRDLQSFIFIFQRHNRIVLERPEYGYATYFFELLNSVPVAWQIKRLVTAMKLTSCGRNTVIENRPLLVGEDLSEGEAKVLAEYGWTPNTGLGTMLNYCDRVVHDRKQELDSSEWRMKIGKQLMNGYNGGNLVADNLPKRLTECRDFQNVHK